LVAVFKAGAPITTELSSVTTSVLMLKIVVLRKLVLIRVLLIKLWITVAGLDTRRLQLFFSKLIVKQRLVMIIVMI
jgi:hypothetical protein